MVIHWLQFIFWYYLFIYFTVWSSHSSPDIQSPDTRYRLKGSILNVFYFYKCEWEVVDGLLMICMCSCVHLMLSSMQWSKLLQCGIASYTAAPLCSCVDLERENVWQGVPVHPAVIIILKIKVSRKIDSIGVWNI